MFYLYYLAFILSSTYSPWPNKFQKLDNDFIEGNFLNFFHLRDTANYFRWLAHLYIKKRKKERKKEVLLFWQVFFNWIHFQKCFRNSSLKLNEKKTRLKTFPWTHLMMWNKKADLIYGHLTSHKNNPDFVWSEKTGNFFSRKFFCLTEYFSFLFLK